MAFLLAACLVCRVHRRCALVYLAPVPTQAIRVGKASLPASDAGQGPFAPGGLRHFSERLPLRFFGVWYVDRELFEAPLDGLRRTSR